MPSQTPQLRLPVIQAPMFLLSGPEMVIASARAGVMGSFPTPNTRTPEQLEQWLIQITQTLANTPAERNWAINLIMHPTYQRRQIDLELAVKYRAPVVITALGSPKDALEAVHSYGGKVYADVINLDFAKKAAAAGADGLALVCAGAGGHTGFLSPFAFLEEVRRFFDGDIILSGAIGTGKAIHAAKVLGADYVYMGTRFIASQESMAVDDYKTMVTEANIGDIVTSDAITGVKANWLKDSLITAGFDPNNMPSAANINFAEAGIDSKRWKDIWAAGQGVGTSTQVDTIATIVDQLEAEYRLSLKGQQGE
ncbi:MAG: nitronate monooxygenase [Halieaceae bacterium]|nr:nitronate monooxygenase [Halieaceae bacterium]